MKIFSSISFLKECLKIPNLNTGRKFTHLGFVYDDIERLHVLGSDKGDCVHLTSGVEFQLFEYRGQTKDFGTCFSGLDRCQTEFDLLLALCRTIYFEHIVAEHPALVTLRQYSFSGKDMASKPLCINLQSIAQHYGLATEFIDITKNFDVASFFATQSWNSQKNSFEPLKCTDGVGLIYQITPSFEMLDDNISYIPVGWQPFPRPEEQRANAIKLKVKEDFNKRLHIQKFYFQHSWRKSKKIYEQFEGGEKLFPNDNLHDFAELIKNKIIFPKMILNEALNRWQLRKGKTLTSEEKYDLIKKSGITLKTENAIQNYEWSFDETKFKQEIMNLNKRIAYRRASYGNPEQSTTHHQPELPAQTG